MDAYRDFANIYDIFMDNIPYEKWCGLITGFIEKYGRLNIPEGNDTLASEAHLLVDLGCGTGVMTRLLKAKGFDCIGIDLSPEMLEVAASYGDDILYLNQDMRSFDLYSTVGYVISVCDSINYLLEDEDVTECFKLVNNYLYPGGLFIFDFNTVENYASTGDSTIAENRPEGSFIWENYYDPDSHINEYDLTLYIKNEEGTYNRSEETHIQRGYTLDEMLGFLKKAGLKVIEYIDSDTGKKVSKDTARVMIVAAENTKASMT